VNARLRGRATAGEPIRNEGVNVIWGRESAAVRDGSPRLSDRYGAVPLPRTGGDLAAVSRS
jgi:hypothetical protein